MSCNVCFDPFSKVRPAVICPSCPENKKERVCIECTKDYIVESTQKAHCMSCKHEWSHGFLAETFPNTFLIGKYRKSRQAKALEREKGLLPQTVQVVEEEKKRRHVAKKLNDIRTEMTELKKKHVLEMRALTEKLILEQEKHRNGGEAPTKNIYMFPCPEEECRGYIEAKKYKCGVCDVKLCRKCHAVKDEDHECVEADVETAKMVKKDTKPCPKCSVRIFKIHGCNQMFCTNCHTAFNWNTLAIVTGVIHNPHYYELQNKLGRAPRAAGDIVCGGIPEWFYVEQCLKEVIPLPPDQIKAQQPAPRIVHNRRRGRHQILEPIVTSTIIWAPDEIIEYMNRIHERSSEIEDSVRQKRQIIARNEMERIRMEYLIGDIKTEDSFKRSIFLKERRLEKITEELQILDTFLASMSERFNDLIAENQKYNEKRVKRFIKDAEKIQEFCNEAFATTWKAMNYKKIPSIDFEVFWRN